MNWKSAKTRELYVIAFDDAYATNEDKLAAAAEIERRKQQKYGRLQNKEVALYPK